MHNAPIIIQRTWDTFVNDGIRQLCRRFDVNRAVFFGILTRIWGMAAGPLTALLIAIKFSPEYQGYYYTFASLLALQVFVELGLGMVVIQFASHEWSKLRMDADGGISGDTQALSRLSSLANIVVKWFITGGLIIAIGLSSAGFIFFSHAQTASHVDWTFPWFALCLLTGISICLIPVWSLLEGCNQVSAVYTYRFLQGLVSSVVIWIAIASGAKLWSASFALLATLVCAMVFLYTRYRMFIRTLYLFPISGERIHWKEEIFPMQWRIALSWISGYFVFSLFTPVIFHYHGAVAAGQFGMTWSVVGVVSMIAGAWLPPKVPVFGMLIAKKDYAQLDFLFGRVMKIFSLITMLVAAGAWLAIWGLNKIGHPLANRLLPVFPTTIFLIAQVIMGLSMPFSAYLRAHKKEPLLYVSLASGVLTAISTLILGKFSSVTAIGLGYLLINVVVVPVIVIIWYRCRRQWHSDDGGIKDFSLRQEYNFRRIKEKGLLYCASKAAQHVLYQGLCQVAGLVAWPVCRLKNVKFIYLSEWAIGHLCVEPDCYIKEGILGMRPDYHTIMLVPRASNNHLLDYWEKYLKIVRSGLMCKLLEPLARNRLTGYETYRFAFAEKGPCSSEVQKKYAGRPPLLSLTESDRSTGQEALSKLGVPSGAWFVCLHCREDGYLGNVNQSLRNADIGNYFLAMEAITKRGGWVIRMGDPTMKKLPTMEGVIDYAHSPLKSESMDIFLCASGKFFLGSLSGLYHVSNVFGIPAAIANISQMSSTLPYGPGDMGIPKLIWSQSKGRYLSFREVLSSPCARFSFDHLFEYNGLRPVENSPEEIRALALEMLDKCDGHVEYAVEDEALQEGFKSLMDPTHLSYGLVSRVGRDFLRKHKDLLEGRNSSVIANPKGVAIF